MRTPDWKLAPMILMLGLVLIAPRTAAADSDAYGTGGGSIHIGDVLHFITFAFSAHSGPQGDFGSFRVTTNNPPLDVHVDVDCLNVFSVPLGAAGWISGLVKKVSPESNAFGISPGSRMVFFIADYGNRSDPITDQLALAITQADCKTLGPSSGLPISQGNIVIKLP